MSKLFRNLAIPAVVCAISSFAATTAQSAELHNVLQALPFETLVFDANHGQRNVAFNQFGTHDYVYSGRNILLVPGHLEARFINDADKNDCATFSSAPMPAGPTADQMELATKPHLRKYSNFQIVAERTRLRNNSTYSVKIVGVAHGPQGNVDMMTLALETVTFSGQPAPAPAAPKSGPNPNGQLRNSSSK